MTFHEQTLRLKTSAGIFTGTYYTPDRVRNPPKPTQTSSKCPLVICLHGFPDIPEPSFICLVTYLVTKKQTSCFVPHLRGYESTSVQAGKTRSGYHMVDLAGDVLDWIKDLRSRQLLHPSQGVVLIGHDWGSIVAQATAALVQSQLHNSTYHDQQSKSGQTESGKPPQLQINIRGLVLMAVPPFRYMFTIKLILTCGIIQLLYSFYILLFQTPWIPEMLLSKFSFIAWLWRRWSPDMDRRIATQRGECVAQHLLYAGTASHLRQRQQSINTVKYVSSIAANSMQPNHQKCITAALAYYRCFLNPFHKNTYRTFNLLTSNEPWANKARSIPTLALYGQNDGCIHPKVFRGSCEAGGVRHVCIKNAGHWLHLEQPVQVQKTISEFLSSQLLP